MNKIHLMIAVLIAIGLSACNNKEAEENARKAKLYDDVQAKTKRLDDCLEINQSVNSKNRREEWVSGNCPIFDDLPKAPMEIQYKCSEILGAYNKMLKDGENRCVNLYK